MPKPFIEPSADTLFAHPARILTPTLDVERMLKLVEEKVYDPAILQEDRELFFWPAEISSDRLDAYYTRMARSSLLNYAAEAEEGVTFQNSHRWAQLGFGQSLSGTFEEDGERQRVLAWFYTLSGLRLNDVSTDDLIAGIKAALIRDVSIGFHGGRFVCAICQRSLWDWECSHIPGLHYEIEGEDQVHRTIQAFAWVEDAHLSEVSAVYDGATPGAAILKAEREAEAGRMNDKARRLLEKRYRMQLPSPRRSFRAAGANGAFTPEIEERLWRRIEAELSNPTQPITQPEDDMSIRDRIQWSEADEDGKRAGSLHEDDLNTLLEAHEGAEGLTERANKQQRQAETLAAELKTAQGRTAELETELATAKQEQVRLQPLADMGEQYQKDLVDAALGEGVRALGETFDADTYRPLLEAAPIATVKRMRDDWQAQADALFSGGRKVGAEHEPPGQAETPEIEKQAYRT